VPFLTKLNEEKSHLQYRYKLNLYVKITYETFEKKLHSRKHSLVLYIYEMKGGKTT